MGFDRQDLEQSLEITEAMVNEFEDYLLDDDLYRQLMVETPAGDRMPNMSAGSLLEVLHDLTYAEETDQLTSRQRHRLAELRDTFEQLTSRFAQRYREKLARELKSQIDSWRWFLQDCRDDPLQCQDEYPFEVRIRNRIELLMDALNDDVPADQLSRLQKLDRELQRLFTPGEFILDRQLLEHYPSNRYWWLYGRPGEAD